MFPPFETKSDLCGSWGPEVRGTGVSGTTLFLQDWTNGIPHGLSRSGCRPGGGSLVATSAPVTHFFRSRKEDNTDCSSSHGSVQGWLPHFKEWQIEAQRCPVPGIPFSPLAQEFWSLIVMLF